MKYKCFLFVVDFVLMDCCCVVNNVLEVVVNFDGVCNICNNDGNYII